MIETTGIDIFSIEAAFTLYEFTLYSDEAYNCEGIELLPFFIERQHIKMHSKTRQTILLPPLEDKLGILENEWCMPVGVNITLEGFGRVPFLSSVSDKMILLQSPASRVYVGR